MALLMSPFFAVIAVAAARERAVALKGVLVMLLFTVAAILPITIRNYVITRRFIPLTVGLGIIMTQAIADYDFDMKYGLPKHPDLPMKEAEWYKRPDYSRHFLRPDGIERDNARVWRTLDVIKRHPGYYLSTVARRMDFMLRCDRQAGPDDWPFNTANPIWISKHTFFGHGSPESLTGREVLSRDRASLVEHLNPAQKGRVSLHTDESSGITAALLTASAEDDQQLLTVPSIEVNRRTDYVLTIDATVDEGSITALVTGDRENRELGSKTLGRPGEAVAEFDLPFASQDNTNVSMMLANDRPGQEACSIRIRSIRLIEIGSTPYSWSDHFRWAVRGLQRNLYATPAMRALWIIGLAVLLLVGRRQEALWVAAVPVYYLLFQSLLHTEYRYIIPIHYFLIAFAAVGLHTLVQMLVDAFRRVRGASRA